MDQDHTTFAPTNNIARLVAVPAREADNSQDTSEISELREELSALRAEISRRDDVLKLVLERLPAPDAADARLESVARERDAAHARFAELQDLLSVLVHKVSSLAGPETVQVPIESLRKTLTAMEKTVAGLSKSAAADRHRIADLEDLMARTLDSISKPQNEGEVHKLAQEIAAVRARQASDRAMVAEMRLDLNDTRAQTRDSGQSVKRVQEDLTVLAGDVADIRKRVLRFLLDQMRLIRNT